MDADMAMEESAFRNMPDEAAGFQDLLLRGEMNAQPELGLADQSAMLGQMNLSAGLNKPLFESPAKMQHEPT